jgi:hypothetical protein
MAWEVFKLLYERFGNPGQEECLPKEGDAIEMKGGEAAAPVRSLTRDRRRRLPGFDNEESAAARLAANLYISGSTVFRQNGRDQHICSEDHSKS